MATDFMARRALLLSNLLISCFCFSCHFSQNEKIKLATFNADTLHIKNKNGIAFEDNKPFSGKIYKLNSEKKDTLFVIGFYKGKQQGEWKHFYPNGQIKELRYFYKGKKVKTLMQWWKNGNKELACTFKNGEYEGELKMWNVKGHLIKQMHYKNGYESGSEKMFYDDGKIRSNYVVKNDRRIGLLGRKSCVNESDSAFKK